MRGRRMPTWAVAAVLAASLGPVARKAPGAELEVGPGRPFERIGDALERAAAGDVIRVHARPGNAAYEREALRVRVPRLTIVGVPGADGAPVKIDGTGFAYSGVGSVPRAIVQFDAGSDGGTLEGFELFGAHNESDNGAGVRINQANHVTVQRCHIHHNDMGMQSGGDGTLRTAAGQRIRHCTIHHNGSNEDPGYNHNLYLGGTSVLMEFCDVHSSLTGHNFKSRAHVNWLQYNYIHGAANREVDLVDAADTTRPGSHAVLLGNVIAKDPESQGNRTVIHFGQDGGKEHDGTLYLVHNTIVTPFIAPVAELSTPGARAELVNNLVSDGGIRQANQIVAAVRNGAKAEGVSGRGNVFGRGFDAAKWIGTGEAPGAFGADLEGIFDDLKAGNYRPTRPLPGVASVKSIRLPEIPGHPSGPGAPLKSQYRAPADREDRRAEERPTVGAYAFEAGR